MRSPPLPNVTWHSGGWSYTVTPSIDQTLHQYLTLLHIRNFLSNLTFYLIARGFHGTFATGAACQQRTLTPETLYYPSMGLASVLMMRPISPELVLFLDFWVSNIPRYLYFTFFQNHLSRHGIHLFASLKYYMYSKTDKDRVFKGDEIKHGNLTLK